MFNSVTKLSHVSFVRETGELRVTVHVFEACLRHSDILHWVFKNETDDSSRVSAD